MNYRLDELAQFAQELGLQTRRTDNCRLDICIDEGCCLAFCNLFQENDTLVGFDGTPWHAHGVVQFLTGESTYIECDELEIMIGLGSGELVVVSQFFDDQLHDRWISHKLEPLDLRYLQPGEEMRIFRLRNARQRAG